MCVFPANIPVKRGMPPANRELHVVAGVVIFPTHPGSHVNLLRVGKTLCAKAAVREKNAQNFWLIFPCFLSAFARIFDLAPDVRFQRSWYRRKACAALFYKVLDLWKTELRTERYGPANRGGRSVLIHQSAFFRRGFRRTGESLDDPRVARRARTCLLSNAPKLADQLVVS